MHDKNKSHRLKIIIFDGSFKTTPFINRLVKGLAENHEIYILGFNETLNHRLDNVNYVSLGNKQNKLQFIITSLAISYRIKGFRSFFKTFYLFYSGQRKVIEHQSFKAAVATINPDVIHLQWPSVLHWCETFLQTNKYKVVLSQRGSQTNIVPFTDEVNLEYLKKWYPKIAGFHSVSKAISEKGNLIWNDTSKIDAVIYTGLQLEQFTFDTKYKVSKPLALLSVGRAHSVKGYEYALRSCKLLKNNGVSFQYTIIGGAEDEELLYLINDLNLEKEVVLKPRMPQAEVFKIMKSSSLLIVPSIAEGIPNVAVEAMAIGLPSLSTACGGVPELIENNCEGWTVPTRNPEAMTIAIEKFIKTPITEIEKIRQAARRKVEKQHAENQMVEGMERLYKEVIKL